MDSRRTRVWIVFAEVRVKGADEDTGAFMEFYVPGGDILDAIEVAKDEVDQLSVDLLDISQCLAFKPEDWTDENDPDHEVRSAVAAALEHGTLQVGEIRNWKENE